MAVCPWLKSTLVALAVFQLAGCATVSRHTFTEPVAGWQTRIGQLMYQNPNRKLIADALVRFSQRGDFELTLSKGPGITLLSLREDSAFAEVKGVLGGQGWSGRIEAAPSQLRGWLALRDQFVRAPNQKTIKYAAGNEKFLFRL